MLEDHGKPLKIPGGGGGVTPKSQCLQGIENIF